MYKYKILIFVLAMVQLVTITSCFSDSRIASRNLSTAADNFEIDRRIVFYNAITDSYMLVIEGRCSVFKDVKDNQLEVTCKVSETGLKKHYLGLSRDVTYFIEQLESKAVDEFYYKVIFKPQSVIPDINIKTKLSK